MWAGEGGGVLEIVQKQNTEKPDSRCLGCLENLKPTGRYFSLPLSSLLIGVFAFLRKSIKLDVFYEQIWVSDWLGK